jgi:TPP-dependent pyruvate/acetoin dehydrogenase alpha subunit
MKKNQVKPGAAPAPPGDGEFSLIPHNKLLALYEAMLKCRTIANRAADRRRRTPLIAEAVTVGVTIDLLASDVISPAPSDLSPCAVKSAGGKAVALKTLLRWWRHPSIRIPRIIARANVIPPAASIAARLEVALRLAADFRSSNSDSVIVFFTGPDLLRSKPADSPTVSHKLPASLLTQAAAQRLPILFVAQSEADADELNSIFEQCGVPGMVVDRDDVVAVYRVASEALTHARRGNGPTLIDTRHWRPKGRLHQTRKSRDPIGKMELYLAGKGLAYRSVKDKVLKEFAAEIGRT